MDDRNTIEITLPMYARPRSEIEQKAIQDLVDEIKDQHGVDISLSPQMEYRSVDLADAIRAFEVLVGSNAHVIVRPVIDKLIRQVMTRFQSGPASGQDVRQPVNYVNGDQYNFHITIYNLKDGTADDEDDKSP